MTLPFAAALVGLLVLLVWLLRLRTEAEGARRQARALDGQIGHLRREIGRLESERGLLAGFLGVLPALALELRYATTERQVMATLIETLISTIEPRQAVILMRRRRRGQKAVAGERFVVAATTPGESSIRLGQEVLVTGASRDPRGLLAALGVQAPLSVDGPLTAAPIVLDDEVAGWMVVAAPSGSPQTPRVVQALADMGVVALHEVALRRRMQASADVDELTNVFNKRHITRVLSEELHKVQRGERPLSLVLFDIDHFKHYNDVNGHLSGDILLRLLAQLVHDNLRSTDTIGRFGGEEFLIVLPGASLDEAHNAAEKLRSLVASHGFPGSGTQPGGILSVSGGVAAFPVHGTATPSLLRAADQALYAAKSAGRNQVLRAASGAGKSEREPVALEEEWGE
jgi:diguanylate cyclase (GGDEF)-like protein